MYYIVYGLLYLVSLLPLRVLYIFSDAAYGLTYYILRYRRDVVMNNLLIAFPEKTEKERIKIAKRFYHNLIDTFIETIKMISASGKYIDKRFAGNWELLNSFKETGRPIQLHLGHNFNWEWGNVAGACNIKIPFLGVYMPIQNKIFDRLFRELRSKHGTILLRATKMAEDFIPYRNTQYLLGLVADQNPGGPGSGWWFNFFGRPTPFVKGPARGAINANAIIVFGFIHKIKRGRYETVFTLSEENPQSKTEIELTQQFVVYLENVIRTYPDMWLWSHRRWKYEWKPEYGPVT
jgi:Kdo2-lipid IVA lauroyltransferase/acyltransferase